MFVPELIRKKRDGEPLTAEEIDFLVEGFTRGAVSDYQMAAFLMAVYFQGMTEEETARLTTAMARSGDMVDLSGVEGVKVDKHSTGGIADTTTLVLLPLAASAGVKIAKLSGRGLGHTGGTIDKLESIPGFRTSLDPQMFVDLVRRIGVAISSQSDTLVPADRKLYALRDVTATVDSIPLIASSVMSKKIAGGADKIVLDVKTGRGAFMKDRGQAEELARWMVRLGEQVGRETVAFVTDMDQPLGLAIGNALEVIEAIETLKGNGHPDLLELCVALGAQMMVLAGLDTDLTRAGERLRRQIESGAALAKFRDIIRAQGGPQAKYMEEIHAEVSGYIRDVDAVRLGRCAMQLGAGRQHKEDPVDPAVGIWLGGKVGDRVEKGGVLARVYANDPEQVAWAVREVRGALSVSERPVPKRPVILARITKEDL
jgi:pyrimidine-nucleoside phosphorylase